MTVPFRIAVAATRYQHLLLLQESNFVAVALVNLVAIAGVVRGKGSGCQEATPTLSIFSLLQQGRGETEA